MTPVAKLIVVIFILWYFDPVALLVHINYNIMKIIVPKLTIGLEMLIGCIYLLSQLIFKALTSDVTLLILLIGICLRFPRQCFKCILIVYFTLLQFMLWVKEIYQIAATDDITNLIAEQRAAQSIPQPIPVQNIPLEYLCNDCHYRVNKILDEKKHARQMKKRVSRQTKRRMRSSNVGFEEHVTI